MERVQDPLRFGDPNDDDMEDLTAQLEQQLQTSGRRASQDSIDLGNAADLGDGSHLAPHSLDESQLPPMDTFASYGQLVLPPSYEESFLCENVTLPARPSAPSTENNEIRSPTLPTPMRHSNQLLHIRVSDPVKREQTGLFGMKGGYISYLVSTQTQLPNYKPNPQVRRRFKDFVALADLLKVRFRGYFVPPRPEKNAVEAQRLTDGFVEERRLALEKYVNRLAKHPIIACSEELRLFLQCEEDLTSSLAWTSMHPLATSTLVEGTAKFSKQLFGLERGVVDPVQATLPAAKTGDFMRVMKEARQGMSSATSAKLSEEEMVLRQEKERCENRKEALLLASRAAERLVRCMDKQALVYGDLGLSLFKVFKYEETDGRSLANYTGTNKQSSQIMADCRVSGTTCVRVGRLHRKATAKSAMELMTLHEHLAFMPAVTKGLGSREHQLLTSITLDNDLESKKKQITDLEVAGAKVFGGDQSKLRRVADLRSDVAKLELSVQAAHAEYDKIMTVNMQELTRLRTDTYRDYLAMMTSFVTVSAAASERCLEYWLVLARELGASDADVTRAKSSLAGVALPTTASSSASQSPRDVASGSGSAPERHSPSSSGGSGGPGGGGGGSDPLS